MKIIKLDKRYNGNQWFKYCIEYGYKEGPRYVEHRTWAWTNFSASCELEYWITIKPTERWCWDNTQYYTRIYLASDAELNWIKMAFPELVV